MNYERIYNEFIQDRLERDIEDNEYYEIHHILPKSLGGTDSKDNLIKLTYSDHIFAHELLARIYNTGGMWSAVLNMCNRKTSNKKSRLLLEQSRKECRERMTGENNPAYGKPNVRRGTTASEESKQKMRESANKVLDNGLTVAQNRNMNTSKKMGEGYHKDRTKKTAQTMRENGLYEKRQEKINQKYIESGKFKVYQLYDTNDVLVFEGIRSELKKWCEENKASWYTVSGNSKVKERMYENNKRVKQQYAHMKNYNCIIKGEK